VGLFKVTRGRGGRRTISQINTGEEGALRHNKVLREAQEKLAKEAAKKPLEQKDATLFRPVTWEASAAYRALAEGLYKRPAAWTEQWIRKITNPEELKRIRLMEEAHPKYKNGRRNLLALIDDREVEVAPPAPPPPAEELDEKPPETVESPCPHCDFKAGSEEGLKAHLEVYHPDIEL
jgi:hypothetical protein